MAQPCPNNLPQLPTPGQPLLITPTTASVQGVALWPVRNGTWQADVLDCGLIAWSTARPMTPATARAEAVRLRAPGLLERIHGAQRRIPSLLPHRGEPVVSTSRAIYWLRNHGLMNAARLDNDVINWGSTAAVEVDHLASAERASIRETMLVLRDAAGRDAQRQLVLPDRDGSPRDIIVADRSITSVPRSGNLTKTARLCLRTGKGYRLHSTDGVVLDAAMALDLAAELAAYPRLDTHPADDAMEPTTITVTHSKPDREDRIITAWQVAEGLAVLHDARHSPLTVWLRARKTHALTEAHAHRLASALCAAAAHLDRLLYLTVTAAVRDHERSAAVQAERDFVAALRAATVGTG